MTTAVDDRDGPADRKFLLGIVGMLCAAFGVCMAGCIRDDGSSVKFDRMQEPRSTREPEPNHSQGFRLKTSQMANVAKIVADRNISFLDVSRKLGLKHEWPQQKRPITTLQTFGSGCATFDGDNDGWQDVLLVGDPHPKLFQNIQGTGFQDVTESSGLSAVEGDWMGCAVGDYNGDGLLDVLITGYHRLALFKNLGDMQFEVATEGAGLDPVNGGHWGASAGFMDLDGDQWLDLVILNYVVYGPDSKQYCELQPGILSGCNPRLTYPPERGEIWRNTGSGHFELVPQSQGMESTHGMGLVMVFLDLDDDGRIDFYIGNDGTPSELMHNLGGMRFENIAQLAGVSSTDQGIPAAMSADLADYDGDGILDLAITDWQGVGSGLFRGIGGMLFLNCSHVSGLTRNTSRRMGFGAKWVDFENDGWPDLFQVNGHVYDNSAEVGGPEASFRQQISFLSNDRGKKFEDLVSELGADVQRTLLGRGSATLDFDNDGRMDLLAVDFEGPVMLLQNTTETANHWLKLDLRGDAPNVFAYGARVTGKASDRLWQSEVSPCSSYLSSSDPRIHWGLGTATALDTVVIRWPSGVEQTLTHVVADRILQVREESQSP